MVNTARSKSTATVAVFIAAIFAALTLALPDLATRDAFAQERKAVKPQSTKSKPSKAQLAKKDEPWPINDDVEDPAVWGKVFPLHYELYKKTVDMQRTKYGGSEAVPRTPTQADPRALVSRTKVDEDIGLKTMWQGYAFAADFREERGHAYMLEDQKFTQRQQVVQQPGACMNCHASTYLANKKAGDGDITKGFEKINAMPYSEAVKLVQHPVTCIDCHDGQNMSLRITRPAFIEGIRAYKASQGIQNYDVNKQATPNEMRAYVCGQCHVEYYFKGPEKRLVYPVGERPEGRADPGLLRRDQVPRLDAQGHRRAGAEGPASGVRAVEPGHSRPRRRDVRRLPHAEDQHTRARR